MTETPKRRLGDIAYIICDGGTVMQTIVGRLSYGPRDQYSLLSYGDYFSKHYFNFAEAVAVAVEALERKKEALELELETVRERMKKVQSPDYERKVRSEPIKIGNHLISLRVLGGFEVPKEYWEPGQEVYAVITPQTHNTFLPHYRPHPYYILRTKVKEALLCPDGTVTYRIESGFSVSRGNLFTDQEEAKTRLIATVLSETGGVVPRENVVIETLEQDTVENKKISDSIHKRVSKEFKHFEKLSDGD